MHRSSVPNRAANSRSPAIRSPSADPGYATQRREGQQEHLANLSYLDRDILLYPLFWRSNWSQELADATRYVFGIGVGFGVLLVSIYHFPLTEMRIVAGPTLAQQAAKRLKRLAIVEKLRPWFSIANLIIGLIFIVVFWMKATSALSLGKGATWWDYILVALSGIWSLMLCIFFFRSLPLLDAIKHYRFPGFALLKALWEALDAVRDEHLWFDFEHRLIIAYELAKAADIVEGPMRQRFVGKTGGMSAAVVGPRLASLAAALRRKLIWVATPMSETRQDLERFLRDAVLAAAIGKIDSLGTGETVDAAEATVERPRVWLARLMALAKGAVFAIIPLGVVWLALKFGFITLSSEADKATAQNAALLWLVLSIIRMLNPGSFKDISDAVLKSLGRSKD
jgi:hypothetical protein